MAHQVKESVKRKELLDRQRRGRYTPLKHLFQSVFWGGDREGKIS